MTAFAKYIVCQMIKTIYKVLQAKTNALFVKLVPVKRVFESLSHHSPITYMINAHLRIGIVV